MKIRYTILNPTGNITLLVEDEIPVSDQPATAAKLMELEPDVEQVGFYSVDTQSGLISLRMAGGEFCGNATMSAAALWCSRQKGIEIFDLEMQVSGCCNPVPVTMQAKNSAWLGSVQMPEALNAESIQLEQRGKVYSPYRIDFSGITHFILTEDMEKTEAEEAVISWCDALHLQGLGLMFYQPAAKRLKPLVYIPGADTLYWESSCASGTTAVGVWFFETHPDCSHLIVHEPAGDLQVEKSAAGIRLTGSVSIINTKEIIL